MVFLIIKLKKVITEMELVIFHWQILKHFQRDSKSFNIDDRKIRHIAWDILIIWIVSISFNIIPKFNFEFKT
jgi:hypothetical protein